MIEFISTGIPLIVILVSISVVLYMLRREFVKDTIYK